MKSFPIFNLQLFFFLLFLFFHTKFCRTVFKYLYCIKFRKTASLLKFEARHDIGNTFRWKFSYVIKYNIMRHARNSLSRTFWNIRISCDICIPISTFGVIRASMDSETLWSRHFGAELTAVYTLKLALRAANEQRVWQHLFYLRGRFIWVERMTFVATFDHNFCSHFILFPMYERVIFFIDMLSNSTFRSLFYYKYTINCNSFADIDLCKSCLLRILSCLLRILFIYLIFFCVEYVNCIIARIW